MIEEKDSLNLGRLEQDIRELFWDRYKQEHPLKHEMLRKEELVEVRVRS